MYACVCCCVCPDMKRKKGGRRKKSENGNTLISFYWIELLKMFAFLDIIQSECSKTTSTRTWTIYIFILLCSYVHIHCNVYLTFCVWRRRNLSILLSLFSTRIDYIMRECALILSSQFRMLLLTTLIIIFSASRRQMFSSLIVLRVCFLVSFFFLSTSFPICHVSWSFNWIEMTPLRFYRVTKFILSHMDVEKNIMHNLMMKRQFIGLNVKVDETLVL